MLRATLKDIWARKLRLFTTSLAVLLGVAFMTGTLVLTETIQRTFDDLFATVYDETDAVVRSEAAVTPEWGEPQRPRFDEALVEVVSGVEGVEHAEAEVMGYAQIVGADGEALGDPGMGAPTYGANWAASELLNPFELDEGRAPEGAAEAVIDRGSAERGDLAAGDVTTVLTQAGANEVTIVGVATFGGLDSPGGASFAMFTMEEAQRLLGQPGRVDSIWVVAEDGVSQEEVRARVQEVLPTDLEVVTGAEVTAEAQDELRDNLAFFNSFLLTFALVALFVGSFIIYNTFSIIVAQRGRELALLRAIGASKRQVFGSVVIEAIVVGLVASILGIAAGVGVAIGLKALLAGFGFDIPAGAAVVSSGTVVAALVTGMLVSLGAAVFPARKATRVPPIAAMRDVAVDASGRSRARLAVGAVITAVGIAALFTGLLSDVGQAVTLVGLGALFVFVGVAVLGPVFARPLSGLIGRPLPRTRGVAGNLARENAMRNPKRTSATAAALMIGVGLVAFITILADSARASFLEVLDEAFTGDFVIDSGTFGMGGLSPQLAGEIEALPEVGVASPLRFSPAEIDGSGQMLLAVDPGSVGEILDVGMVEGSYQELGEDTIAVHERRAADLDLAVGDVVPVRFVETGEQQLEVAAIYAHNEVVGNWFISIATAEAHTADQFDGLILINRADGVSPDDARAAIDGVVDGYATAEVQDRREYQETQVQMFNQLLGLVYVLLALAIVIALLGIANTLALSLFERTRELGLLRAVGMSRAQLRSMVRWESVIIALLGTALGLGIGLFFGWAIVTAFADEGIRRFSVPFGLLAIIVALAALAGLLAALLPARRAARLDVLRAISTE